MRIPLYIFVAGILFFGLYSAPIVSFFTDVAAGVR